MWFIEFMLNITAWYAVSLVLTLLGFLFTSRLFPNLFDKGYALAKVIGPFLVCFVSFWLASIQILPFTPVVLWGIVIVLTFLGLTVSRHSERLNTKTVKTIVFEELLFFVFFITFLVYKCISNEYNNVEDYMNFGIVNTLYRTSYLPLEDMWLSGNNLNYYYFSHYTIVGLTKLSFLKPQVTFLLSFAWLFASLAQLTYSLLFTLTRKKVAGFLGIFFFLLSSNLFTLYVNFFYPAALVNSLQNAVRFSSGAIAAEFPAYSFFLWLHHAHKFGLLFIIVFLYICLYIFLHKKLSSLPLVLSLGVCWGTMYMTNGWDFYLTLIPLVMFLCLYFVYYKTFLPLQIMLLFCSSYLATFVYRMYYKVPVSGLSFDYERVSLLVLFIAWGSFLLILVPYVVLVCKKAIRGRFYIKNFSIEELFILLLLATGLAIFLIPMFFMTQDVIATHGPTAPVHFNLFYKSWNYIWPLLSVSVAYIIQKYLLSGVTLKVDRYLLVIVYCLALSVYVLYLVGFNLHIFVTYRDSAYFGLDGTKYLRNVSLDRALAIDYLNTVVLDRPVILEAPGEQYKDYHSIFSSYTGLPTVLGWGNHENVWHNDPHFADQRRKDIAEMYTSLDSNKVKSLVEYYNVSYIIVSPQEAEIYGDTAGDTIKSISTVVFSTDTVSILKFE